MSTPCPFYIPPWPGNDNYPEREEECDILISLICTGQNFEKCGHYPPTAQARKMQIRKELLHASNNP